MPRHVGGVVGAVTDEVGEGALTDRELGGISSVRPRAPGVVVSRGHAGTVDDPDIAKRIAALPVA